MKIAPVLVTGILVGLHIRAPLAAQEVCPPEIPFAFALRAPGSVEEGGLNALDAYVVPDEAYRLEVVAYIETRPRGEEVTVDLCAWFAMSVAHDPAVLELEEVTVEGTDLGNARSFVGAGKAQSSSAVGFIVGMPLCLAPQFHTFTGEMSVVRALYSLSAPHGPEAAGTTIRAEIRFEDGLARQGSPGVRNTITVDGRSVTPCFRDLEVRFHIREDSPFIRGDANFDAVLDISDAASVLRTLFLHGDAPIRCSDAADANDDGGIDLSDAIHIFNHLFTGGPAPEAPFPDPGPDPTPDRIHCIEQS